MRLQLASPELLEKLKQIAMLKKLEGNPVPETVLKPIRELEAWRAKYDR